MNPSPARGRKFSISWEDQTKNGLGLAYSLCSLSSDRESERRREIFFQGPERFHFESFKALTGNTIKSGLFRRKYIQLGETYLSTGAVQHYQSNKDNII
jgi:hypothetical protein